MQNIQSTINETNIAGGGAELNLQIEQYSKFFNLAEKPLMEYLEYILKDVIGYAEPIFNESCAVADLFAEPTVVKPDEDDRFYVLTLERVPRDYTVDFTEVQKVFDVNSLINDLIVRAVYEIYAPIVQQNLTETAKNSVINEYGLSFEYNNGSFEPVSIYPDKRKVATYTATLNQLQGLYNLTENGVRFWDKLTPNDRKRYSEYGATLVTELETINIDEAVANEMELKYNGLYAECDKLGIVLNIYTREELVAKYEGVELLDDGEADESDEYDDDENNDCEADKADENNDCDEYNFNNVGRNDNETVESDHNADEYDDALTQYDAL